MLVKLFIFLIFFLTLTVNAKIITADNHYLSYTGRIDFTDKNKPVISWPGTSIKANFTGRYIAILLDDQNGMNYFNVIIDGNDQTPYVIQAMKGMHEYVISTSLCSGEHQIEIYKRTEGEDGLTIFHGIKIDDNAKLLTPLEQPKRKVEFYGDSITSGLAVEASINGNENNPAEKNNYLTYSSITGRALHAEVHTISQSGIGVMNSWFDFTMPDFYDQLNANGNNDSKWDFSTWTPDIVIVNLLQNDSWIYNTLKIKPSSEDIIENYISFIRNLRLKYPHTHIICALGSMDATKPGSVWPSYINAAVERMKNRYNDPNISTLFFDFNGYEAHPRQYQNLINSAVLIKEIERIMNWD
ncbi:Cellulase/esterase CelE [Dickeya dianthicola]|uniref:Electron transporter RnfD n=1 Tax=Dickeya dianthicola TaxID=204039 RepID=A0AAP2D231_9GAMM|nr:GDSL-type esterase/lipase family protein [Dickeya dianthicola]ATO33569.1 Endoglucanase E precursor EgE (Endo-1,4-beta-glucanase E) (Cellulase E) [Dickeya dianthicola RNS04.9]AYC19456.1 Cellulase/esterase CelE [Dickeya dianthicola]MBI0437618.1 electron transporter RnfD [Dickeya dianthicola]MBI0447880.1 electron transporter RnfD [Dickeya dianthicola]MBI0452497.1 electron transporter RnfD [Dickeya dianthicola]